jgi:maltooligosyltrehalose trehalohydrolase
MGLPSSRTVCFLENHDQVANTGLGSRLYHQVDHGRWRAMTALLLVGPALPMLFQGQEFGSSRPFSYFADHEGDLADAVQNGRLEFLAQFPSLAVEDMRKVVPKPSDARTFESCKLQESERKTDSVLFRLHRDLLRIRRDDVVLRDVGTDAVQIETSALTADIALIRYVGPVGHRLLVVNLGADHLSAMNDPLLAPLPGSQWKYLWSSEHPDYGGCGNLPFAADGPWLVPGGSATLLACVATPG